MSQMPFRCQVRLTLSDLDRGVYAQRTIVVAQQPDEPDEHILLRFLAHVLFFDERLEDTDGWISTQADLQATDLTGQLSMWIECGMPPERRQVKLKRLQKALGHQKSARFIGLFADHAEAETFRQAIIAERPRNLERLEIHLVDEAFMGFLEKVGNRNMSWTATITEGTLYLESDGQSTEVALGRLQVIQGHGARMLS